MAPATIDGSPVALDAAVAEAARLLAASRAPVIAGLGADVAGTRAAIMLAARLGGAIDHMHADAVLRDLDVQREAGVVLTSPGEARLRGDLVLIVGASASPPVLVDLLAHPPAPEFASQRGVVWIGAGRKPPALPEHNLMRFAGGNAQHLPSILAALRARVAGRALGTTPLPLKALDAIAAELKTARFGVAVWTAATLDALAIEMLCGLVADLNAGTRFAGLPLPADDHAAGVLQVCGWMTGFPMRTGFGRGRPEHDPWRFDAARLVDSGEADCAVWISAYGQTMPPWRRAIDTIVLGAPISTAARVQIRVGTPGIGHDAAQFDPRLGALAWTGATVPAESISVADAIARITGALADGRQSPC